MEKIETEVVIVGSGAAGATLAKELCEKKRDVTLVEKGEEWSGPTGKRGLFGGMFRPIGGSSVRSKEGVICARGITTGGSTMIYQGNAFRTLPPWLKDEFGIDLSGEIDEAIEEIGIKLLPKEWYDGWAHATRLVEAAGEVGINLKPQLKYVYPDKCDPNCDHCMRGCERNARWTAKEFVDQAREGGARVLVETDVREAMIVGNRAVGVKAKGPKGPVEILADKVVLCAGGIGTPMILQRTGMKEAGNGFYIDPLSTVSGITKDAWEAGGGTFAYASDETVETEHFIIGNVAPNAAYFMRFLGSARGVRPGHGSPPRMGARLIPSMTRGFLDYPQRKKALGLFIKMGDSPEGRIDVDGSISKPYNKEDEARMAKGIDLCKKILVKAGADPESFSVVRDVGGHPGGTAALDRVVDRSLETKVERLYVCDASILPYSPGRPPSLLIIALAKWFAKRL